MKRWLLIIAMLMPVSPSFAERPQVNLPPAIRESNWGGGSCVHASTVMMLRWQRQYKMAEWWRSRYSGGENWSGWTTKARAAGLKWSGTIGKRDVAFLERAVDTRRGAMVTCMEGRHMVLLVHLDKADVKNAQAGILDNNDIGRIKWIPRQQFLNEWNSSYSWACAIVYTPPPPSLKKRTK